MHLLFPFSHAKSQSWRKVRKEQPDIIFKIFLCDLCAISLCLCAKSNLVDAQFRVIVSCKFKIARATDVHAANSSTFKSFSARKSPTESSFSAAALSFEKSSKCF